MNGLIILTSMVFVAYIIFRITKGKILKYILPPTVGLVYGFMLFFIGMGVSGVLFLVLAVIPVVAGVLHITLTNYKMYN